MLVGIEEEAAAAARMTLPLLSIVAPPVAADRGIAFMVVTRGMRLESDVDLLGEAVRLLTLGLDEGTPPAPTFLADRDGVWAAAAAEVITRPSPALAAERGSGANGAAVDSFCTDSLVEGAVCPRFRAGVETCCKAAV